MLVTILKLSIIILFSIGFLFVIMDWKTKFDKSFRYFGLSTIAIALYVAIDMWWVSHAHETKNATSLVYATLSFHEVLTLFYFPLLFYYMKILIQEPLRETWIWIAISVGISALLLWTDLFFVVSTPNYNIEVTPWYTRIIAPYILIFMMRSVFISYQGYKKAPLKNKRIFFYHLVGMCVLFASGFLDLMYFLSPELYTEVSHASYALIIYGIITTYAFLERFLEIIQEREALSHNLSQAYRDATEGKTLQQIGESTAKINHELKNYLAIIQNNVPSLQTMNELPKNNQNKLQSIAHASERMNALCDGILDLSRQQPSTDLPVLDLNHSLKKCIDKNYTAHANTFHIIASQEPFSIQIKLEKWEQMLLNLLNNSIEAGATRVTLEACKLKNLIILSIRDNGQGCSSEDLPNLFKAFFTTRRNSGGTGLGLSIARTIVENVGGWISVYKRNPTGMEFNIQLPVPKKGNTNLYAPPSKTPTVYLWAQSEMVLQEVRKKCEQLQLALHMFPLSHWESRKVNTKEKGNILYLKEETLLLVTDLIAQPYEQDPELLEHRLIWQEGGLYVDGDPFSEIFLASTLGS